MIVHDTTVEGHQQDRTTASPQVDAGYIEMEGVALQEAQRTKHDGDKPDDSEHTHSTEPEYVNSWGRGEQGASPPPPVSAA